VLVEQSANFVAVVAVAAVNAVATERPVVLAADGHNLPAIVAAKVVERIIPRDPRHARNEQRQGRRD
jgi:hypothetical protein